MRYFMVHVDYSALAGRGILRLPVVASVGGQLQRGVACKCAKKILLQSGFGSEQGAISSVMPKGVEH